MNFIKATIKDAEEICNNNIDMALESENTHLSSEVALDAVKNLINDPTKGFYLLVKKDKKILGQLMITYEWSDWRNSTIWWIQSVYVLPSNRKIGVFKKLYDEVKRLANENCIEVIRLYVFNENYKAIKAYESIGMKKKPYLIFETSNK